MPTFDGAALRRSGATLGRGSRAGAPNGATQGSLLPALRTVVDVGEYRTIGRHPDGRPWRVGVRDGGDVGRTDRMVDLEDMALAVSGGYGTTFEASGRFHHLFDPRTGASANSLVDVAVMGPRATAADGLATAICVAGEALAPTLVAAYPQTRAMLTRVDGTSMTFTAQRRAPLLPAW